MKLAGTGRAGPQPLEQGLLAGWLHVCSMPPGYGMQPLLLVFMAQLLLQLIKQLLQLRKPQLRSHAAATLSLLR